MDDLQKDRDTITHCARLYEIDASLLWHDQIASYRKAIQDFDEKDVQGHDDLRRHLVRTLETAEAYRQALTALAAHCQGIADRCEEKLKGESP